MKTETADLKPLVRSIYDLQKLRIMMGNRVVQAFKTRIGQKPGMSEEELDENEQKVLASIRKEYKKITEGWAKFPRTGRSFKGTSVIHSFGELVLVHEWVELKEKEDSYFSMLRGVLKDYPIWTEFMEGVKGVGPAMAGVIISEMDPYKAEYPSSFWKYAGLDVAGDNRGRSRRKEHQVQVAYKNTDGIDAMKNSITFNPFLKTKLTGVLGPSFVKQKGSYYREIYDNYKNRIANMPAHEEKSLGHRNNMAIRYVVKRFLVDLHIKWREIEGLPVSEEYSIAKLGMVHKKAG